MADSAARKRILDGVTNDGEDGASVSEAFSIWGFETPTIYAQVAFTGSGTVKLQADMGLGYYTILTWGGGVDDKETTEIATVPAIADARYRFEYEGDDAEDALNVDAIIAVSRPCTIHTVAIEA